MGMGRSVGLPAPFGPTNVVVPHRRPVGSEGNPGGGGGSGNRGQTAVNVHSRLVLLP